ncbi:hypothetical protein IFR05_004916 [Cadophora sp. M221]|nr:hypothetical protein IFR05_004916 [Cadophora sp. M221]
MAVTVPMSHLQAQDSSPPRNLLQIPRRQYPETVKFTDDGQRPIWAEFVAGGPPYITSRCRQNEVTVRLLPPTKAHKYSSFPHRQQPSTFENIWLAPLYRSSAHHFRETFQILSSIYRIEGWRTLFKGLGPNLAGVVPSSAIKFYTYSNTKRVLSQNIGQETALVHLLAAATAGVATSTVTNPIWLVVRTRLRQAPMRNGELKYSGILQCFRLIWKEEGLVAMYGGLTPHLLRSVPSTAIMFGVYEAAMKFLDKDSQ